MICIILKENKDTVSILGKKYNEKYLCPDNEQEFPLLSEVAPFDIDVFGHDQMEELIRDLKHLITKIPSEHHDHVMDIIKLAKECRQDSNKVLMFNPFLH
ncbi:MAG: hypothetical protein ACFB0B_21315 [Thermonemataceae bacterium]